VLGQLVAADSLGRAAAASGGRPQWDGVWAGKLSSFNVAGPFTDREFLFPNSAMIFCRKKDTIRRVKQFAPGTTRAVRQKQNSYQKDICP